MRMWCGTEGNDGQSDKRLRVAVLDENSSFPRMRLFPSDARTSHIYSAISHLVLVRALVIALRRGLS